MRQGVPSYPPWMTWHAADAFPTTVPAPAWMLSPIPFSQWGFAGVLLQVRISIRQIFTGPSSTTALWPLCLPLA